MVCWPPLHLLSGIALQYLLYQFLVTAVGSRVALMIIAYIFSLDLIPVNRAVQRITSPNNTGQHRIKNNIKLGKLLLLLHHYFYYDDNTSDRKS
jgi:hypothetical protein